MKMDTLKDFLKKGKSFLDNKDYNNALIAYNKAIEHDPSPSLPWEGIGIVYYNLGKHESALEAFNKALTFDPDYSNCLFWKGVTDTELGNFTDAKRAFDHAIELNPDGSYIWHGRGSMNFRLKRYESALHDFYKAIELDSCYSNSWNGIGNVYLATCKYQNALQAYNKAIELNPNCSDYYFGRGNTYENIGNYKKAMNEFQKALELDTSHVYSLYRIGNIYYGLNEYANAIKSYNKVIELNSDFAEAWNAKGDAYRKLRNYEKAVRAYSEAIELMPTFLHPWYGKGCVYEEWEKYDKALKAFNKVIELDPIFPNAWYGRGEALRNLGLLGQSLVAFDRAIEFDSNYSPPWCGKGKVYEKLSNYKNALEAYDRAIEIDPVYSYAWFCKGNLYYNTNKYNESFSYFRRFIFLDAKENIGEIYSYLSNIFNNSTYAPYILKNKLLSNRLNLIILDTTYLPSINECELLNTYILYLKLLNESYKNSFQYHSFLALVNYYFGDPIESYRIYDEIIDCELDCIDLMGQYYFLKSAIDFREPLEAIQDFALKQAREYSQLQKEFVIQEMYYAGQILYFANDFDNAIQCFKKTQGFMPSEYMQLQIFLSQKRPHDFESQRNHIIELENKLKEETLEGYLFGLKKQYINILNENYLQDFMRFFHLNEIIKPLSIVKNFVCDDESPIDEELFKLGRYFEIKESDYITLLETINKKTIENIEKEFNPIRDTDIHEDSLKIKKHEVHSYTKLKEKLDSFNKCSKSDKLEKYLAVFIKENEYKKDIYLKFIQYFLHKKKISYFQALCLYLFSAKVNMTWNNFKDFFSKSQGDILKTILSVLGMPVSIVTSLTANMIIAVVKTFDDFIDTPIDELDKYENFKQIIFEDWCELINKKQIEFDSTIYGKDFDKWIGIDLVNKKQSR